MLSERGLQIIEKLIECNNRPVTSKKLALYLGVSERSVKTYIKEVSDYCSKQGMKLERKPGIGFVAGFTPEQIGTIEEMKKDKKTVMSKKQRMSYIMYILLSGWDTYTLSLFSEELNVSKKVISDDIDSVSRRLDKYKLNINRVAGHGVFVTGQEFEIRKALKGYCTCPIGNREIEKSSDYRLSILDESICVNNFGKDNFTQAVNAIKVVEKDYGIVYTDYSFKALTKYLCIQLLRIRMGHSLDSNIRMESHELCNEGVVNRAAEELSKIGNIELNEYELEYLDIMFASAAIQTVTDEFVSMELKESYRDNTLICEEILDYMSEILNADFSNNELLKKSLNAFVPASFVRTKYGIEIINPFLNDVKEMYSGIFATTFTLSKFYEKYCSTAPTEHEMSMLALYFGGAMHRNTKNVKAILIGTSGVAAANIVARKIENKIEEIKISAILSSEKIDDLEDFEFDIILSMLPGFEYGNKVVNISPIISDKDVKNIKQACFEAMSHAAINNKNNLNSLIKSEYIEVITDKVTKEELLKRASDKLYEGGYVAENFIDDVMYREEISSTAIGNGVAIPHGMAANVCKPIVYVLRLTHGIEWGNETVDTVFLLALNFDNIATTKAFFSDLSRMLGSEEKIEKIRKSLDAEEMENLIKEELHWD